MKDQSVRIVKKIRRYPDAAELTERLLTLGVATVGAGISNLCKAGGNVGNWLKAKGYGDPVGPFLLGLEPAWTIEGGLGPKLCGPVQIVRLDNGSNRLAHYAYTLLQEGDVQVAHVTGANFPSVGMYGDLMTGAMQGERHKAAGLVVLGENAAVRDRADMYSKRFPCYSTGFSPRTAGKTTSGGINDNSGVVVGSVSLRPGDWLLFDADGGIVVPFEWLKEIIDAGEKKFADEEVTRTNLKTQDGVDYYKWRDEIETGATIIEGPIEY